ncbi:hypothetical protein ABE021_09480 [Sporosarcina gallistercoris]
MDRLIGGPVLQSLVGILDNRRQEAILYPSAIEYKKARTIVRAFVIYAFC